MLLAFDLDGTLVTRSRQLPDPIISAIEQARSRGHLITVITGRNQRSAAPFLQRLKVEAEYGTCQGARVHGPGNAHHSELTLHPSLVHELLDRYLDNFGDQFYLSGSEGLYVHHPQLESWDWARNEGQGVQSFDQVGQATIHKAVFSRREPLAEIQRAHPDLTYYPWDPEPHFEVLPQGGNKGEALALLCRILSVSREDTVAFGDGNNDISMLQWAGHGVGVGEVATSLLPVTDELIPAPEQLGVATWIRENLL